MNNNPASDHLHQPGGLPSVLEAAEARLRQLRYEVGIGFSHNGATILEVVSADDQPFELTLTGEDVELLRSAKGATFTHNHPRGWCYPVGDPRRAGSAFSPDDVLLACRAELAQLRAVSPGYTFTLSFPNRHFLEEDWEAISSLYEVELAAARIRMAKRVRAGHLSREEYAADLLHITWHQVAGLLGMAYNRLEASR